MSPALALGALLSVQVARDGRSWSQSPAEPLCEGDQVVLTVSPPVEGVVVLDHHGPDGERVLLYPDRPGAPHAVGPDHPMRLPSIGTYRIRAPTGTERFELWVSPLGAAPAVPTVELADAEVVGLRFRSFELDDAPAALISGQAVRVAFTLESKRCGR